MLRPGAKKFVVTLGTIRSVGNCALLLAATWYCTYEALSPSSLPLHKYCNFQHLFATTTLNKPLRYTQPAQCAYKIVETLAYNNHKEEEEMAIPSTIGGWILGKSLGEGTCGSVFFASKGGEKVSVNGALKIVRHKKFVKKRKNEHDNQLILLGQESTQLSRLLATRVANPHLPRLLQRFTTEGDWSFLVIEYFKKGSLADWKKHDGAISRSSAFGIGFRLVKGLQMMHEAGVGWLHLDVKPENVMLSDDPKRGVCLVDFGLTVPIPYTLLAPRKCPEGSSAFMGTHVWNSERQSRRDDLEAAGLTLAWLLLDGNLPWLANEPDEMCRQIQATTMPDFLARKCKAPALRTYLKRVRGLGVDEIPPYQDLLDILSEEAGPCVDRLLLDEQCNLTPPIRIPKRERIMEPEAQTKNLKRLEIDNYQD